MTPDAYQHLARKRLVSILSRHGIALARTLEHKIADAGPYNQRINPHHITRARQSLVAEGAIIEQTTAGAVWYFNADSDPHFVQIRLDHQTPIYSAFSKHGLTTRVGQSLEIAIDRGLSAIAGLDYLGGFLDLDQHSDATLFTKDGPPSRLGTRVLANQQKLDFLVRAPGTDIWAGIEAKNIRSWLYPNAPEIASMLRKAITLNVIPVLIARRIPFVTGSLLRRCGCITWETLRQRFPTSDIELANAAKDKFGLGYSDLTLGNHCDAPLADFLRKLPKLIIDARPTFDSYLDLLEPFAFGSMTYEEFSARVRRRANGSNEDFDEDIELPF